MKRLYWRGASYVALLAACFVAIWPPFDRAGQPGKLKLGLDLRGGTYLVLQVIPEADSLGAGPAPRVAPRLLKEVMQTLERRVNQLGVAEPVITEYGSSGDQVLVQLAGVKDVAQAKRVIIPVAQLSLRIVEEVAPTRQQLDRSASGVVPALEAIEGRGDAPGEGAIYLVRRQAILTGRELRTARVGVDEHGRPNVEFTLKPEAAARFQRETGRHVGRRMAIVLDDRVISAPVIEQAIGASAQIRGRFSVLEADELAKLLRAGALPAKMRYLHQLTIGPSLGADGVRAGLVASAASMLFITVFMLAYYRLSGLNAVVALAANLLLLLAAMACLDATLTLPGIAGIILTVGVGVDTNVLVFERIREELRAGKSVRTAVRAGFDRVWITILDTHATALIAAAFLFQFGTGAIRGFAVTLVMGLAANVVASYFVSRHLFEWVLERRPVDHLSI
jgi:preprotein translocase subunit SecD